MHLTTGSRIKKNIRRASSLFLTALLCAQLAGCGSEQAEDTSDVSQDSSSEAAEEEEVTSEAAEDDSQDTEEPSIDTENTPLYEMLDEDLTTEQRTEGEVAFDASNALSYGQKVHCLFDMPTQKLVFQCSFDQIPSSDDDLLYLFVFNTWDDSSDFSGEVFDCTEKAHTMQFVMDYSNSCMFKSYVPCLKVNGQYYPVSTPKYMTNPETLAPNQSEAPVIDSKKGLLIDPNTVQSEKLTDLNVHRGIYNIPLSQIIGESTNEDMPTTEYYYDGQTYYFNTATLNAYDSLFTYLNQEGIYPTAIILNDWNEDYPEIIHPDSRKETKDSLYYQFNVAEEDGAKLLQATALFLAERYSSGWYGMVYEWVIANEINQHTSWNYMNTTDLDYYVSTFEKSFRIFYNAIKSQYSGAKVYFSIDHDWNDNGGKNSKWFNGKEVVETFNTLALEGGNYDWNLAIHPYPNPLTRVNFWSGTYDMTEDAELLTIMNLSTVTDVLTKDEFLNSEGEVRSIAITELGFTSASGEKLQAAAFAYCYYIIDANPYIDSFMMNRQTDAYEELKNGLAFGVYNTDLSDKFITEVFANIDTDNSDQYTDFMLNIIKADSLEEALSWAVPSDDGQ